MKGIIFAAKNWKENTKKNKKQKVRDSATSFSRCPLWHLLVDKIVGAQMSL